MSDVLIKNIITLVGLMLAMLLIFKKYGTRSLFHPFTIYLITWILSCLAIPLFEAISFSKFFFDPKSVIELLGFVQFNTVIIVIALYVIPVNVKDRNLNIEIYFPRGIFKILAYSILLVVVIYTIATRSSDFQANRESDTEFVEQLLSTGRAPFVVSIISIISSLLIPLTLISGKEVLNKILFKNEYRLPIYYLLPIVISVFTTVVGGARSKIFYSFSLLLVCMLLFYNFQQPVKVLYKRFLIISVGFIILFSSYSTFVAATRTEITGRGNANIAIQNEHLFFLNGVFEYSFFHVLGYQYRKNDVFTPEPEIWGSSLSFITSLSIPFSSQFGINNNLGKLLSIKPESRKQSVSDARGITATIYLNLYDDFGYTGALIAIVVFTLFTQFLFKWIVTRRIRHITSLALFMFIYSLWSKSWFSHSIVGINLVSVFVPYLIIEAFLYLHLSLNKSHYAQQTRWELENDNSTLN